MRPATIGDRFMRLLLPVLVLVCAFSPATPQSGSSPWRFPAGVDRAAVEHRYSPYWWENYESARQILDKGSANVAKLQEAADRLRLTISVESQSSATKQNPRLRTTFEYFPYILLGIALDRQGQFEAAAACLDRENSQALQKTGWGPGKLAELRSSIDSRKANQAYAAMVVKVEGWQQSREGIWLTEAGRGRLAKLLADGRSLAAEQQVAGRQRLQEQIAQGVVELLQVEMQPRKARLEELTSPAWSAAFGDRPLGVNSGVCEPPTGATTAPALTAAQQSFESCVTTVDDALRRAGESACDHLVGLRRQVTDRIDLARRQGEQSSATLPEIPPTCSNTDWNALQATDLWNAVDGLSFPQARSGFVAVLDSIGRQLAGVLEKLANDLTAARSKIPQISSRCGQGMQLGSSATRLAELKGAIDSAVGQGGVEYSEELQAIPGEIDQELARLVERAGRRVTQMVKARDACAGLDTSVLDPLPGLEAAFRRTGGSGGSQFDALCGAVRTADSKINECWGANTSSIQLNLSSYAWFLEVADRSATDEAAGLPCVSDKLAAIRRQPKSPGSNTEVWVAGALSVIGEAQACLGDFHASHDNWVRKIQEQVRGAADTLEEVQVDQGDGLAKTIEEVRQAFRASRDGLDRLAPLLFEQPDGVGEPELRQALEQAGLSGNLAPTRWQDFQGVSGAETSEAILAIRNEAIGPVLAAAAATLVRWEPVVGQFVPMQLLIEAFGHLDRGDLDRAILTLREAGSRGSMPAQGRAGALGHASLAYFLYLKGLAAGSQGDEVAGLLRDDAAREARRALQADAGFALPAALFGNAGFRGFFDDCCSDIRQ